MTGAFIPDVQTLVENYILLNMVCVIVLIPIWLRNRDRFHGFGLWLLSFLAMGVGALLISLRSSIPEFYSVVSGNVIIVSGIFLCEIGLELFSGKKPYFIWGIAVIVIYAIAQSWFTFLQPDIGIRRMLFSAVVVLLSGRIIYFVTIGVTSGVRKVIFGAGVVYSFYFLLGLAGLVRFILHGRDGNEFFRPDPFESFTILVYEMLFFSLVFVIVLMSNRKLFYEVTMQKDKFRKAFQDSPHAIIISRLENGIIVEVNSGFMKITGYKAEEIVGRTASEIGFFNYSAARSELISGLVKSGELSELKISIRQKSGEFRDCLLSAEILNLVEGEHVIATLKDITEAVKAEELLRTKINELEILNRSMLGRESRMAELKNEVNDLLVKLDLPPKYVLSEYLLSIKDKDKRSSGIDDSRGAESIKTATVNLIGDLMEEIEKRKAAEEAISRTEKYFRSLIEKSSDGIVLISREGKMSYASHSAKRMFGYEDSYTNYPSPNEDTHPDDLPGVLAVLARLIETPGLVLNHEYRFRKKDNSYIWIESTFTNLLAEEGINSIVINFRDVSERKEAEAEIRASREMYRLLAENGSDVVWLYDVVSDRFAYVSPSVLQLRGYTVDEVFQQSFREAIYPEDYEMILGKMPSRIESFISGNPAAVIQTNEIRQTRKDGSIVPTEVVTTLIANEQNEVIMIQGVSRDITERKIAEANLIQKLEIQDQLAKIAASVPGMVFTFRFSPDGKMSLPFSTSAFREIWGLDPDDLREDFSLAFERIHPDDRENVIKCITESSLNLTPWKDIFRVIHPQRGELWIEGNSMPKREGDGGVIWYGFAQNVTVRMQIEIALQKSEKRYRELVESANSVIIRYSAEGEVLFLNDFALRFFGYSSDEIIGKHVGLLVPETESGGRDLTELINSIIEHPDDYINFVNENICRDGHRVWLAWNNRPILDDHGCLKEILAIGVDITERKRIEEELLKSQNELDAALDSMTDAVFITDTEGNFTKFNEAFAIFHRFNDKLECCKTHRAYYELLELSFPDGRVALPEQWCVPRALRGETVVNAEYHLRRKDTGAKWIGSYSFSPILNSSGKIVGSVVVGRDITEQKLAEVKIRESEQRFSKVFNSSPVGINIFRLSDGMYVDSNDAFLEIMGYSREEMHGKTTRALNLFVNPAPEEVWANSLMRNIALKNMDIDIRRKNGEIRSTLTSVDVIDINGEAMGLVIVTDITETKVAQRLIAENEAMLRTIFDNSPIGLEIYDKDAILMNCNPKVCELFGVEASTQIGVFNLKKDLNFQDEGVWEKLDRGEEVRLEIRFDFGRAPFSSTRKGIAYHEMIISPIPVEKSTSIGYIVQILDISERKESEDLIRMLNEDLEKRVIERTEQLEYTLKELESFSYSVSHDLRAPLRAVHGYTKVLREDYSVILDNEGKRLCGMIEDSAVKMGLLIDDLLSFSRVGRTELKKSLIDVAALFQSAFLEQTNEKERKSIRFVSGQMPKAMGDESTMKLVVANLVSNAIKYSSKNDNPEINAGYISKVDEDIYFIKDNGVGFDMKYAHKLFGVFQRLHSLREFEGNGVGLAIVQRIIVRHGGRVWADASPGAGATFYFTLPRY
jgi:PAS domain S-box-containing protein